jgi:hypothetical protein
MRDLSPAAAAALSERTVKLVQLVLLDFASGAIGFNSSNWDLSWGGIEYRGAYGLGEIGVIEDSPGEVKGLVLRISGAAGGRVALALDGENEWPGTPVEVRTAILGDDFSVLDAVVDWRGRGDVMGLTEDNDSIVIEATAEATAVDLLRGSPSTYSDSDHQARYPGDLGYQYVVDQANKPIKWPAKSFFYR